jgi:hypothetical protein
MVGLSPLTRQQLEALFAPPDAAGAERLLASECAENLPMVGDATPSGLERLRAAALRFSDGSLIRLRQAIDLAKLDWRDLLVAAGFADDIHAHRRWQPGDPALATVEGSRAGEQPPKRPDDRLRWRVYDDDGVLIAEADLDPAHPLHEAPDGSLSGHAIGRFTPGPGFARIAPMLEEMKRTFDAGELERALAISDQIDVLGLWATDPNGGLFHLSNLQFQQGGLLFFAGTRPR